MRDNYRNLLIVTLLLVMLVCPVSAWFYNEYPTPTPSDTNYEKFGPRVDRLLIKLYSSAVDEWEAMKAGELDTTDTQLTSSYYNQFTTDPPAGYADKVNVVSVGSEFSIRNLDMNQNGERYLGSPENPAYPNPVANLNDTDPKNDYNPVSNLAFRKAILSCINRTLYVTNFIGTGFAIEHWSMLPPAIGPQYYNESFRRYPFNLTRAQEYLDAGGFKLNATTGYRYWDRNSNNVEDANEWVELKVIIRIDDSHRLAAGNELCNQLNTIGVRTNRLYLTVTGAITQWFENKDAHLYTAGLTLGIEPTSITLWLIDYYWHPGYCFNTVKANDLQFNNAARIVETASSFAEAEAAMEICNERGALAALNGPMWVYSSTMANLRKYSGGGAGGPVEEATYKADYWEGTTMVPGYGSDSFFGFLNMHPDGYERPQYGTIRHGFATTAIRFFNPIYAELIWDNKILDLVYDTLCRSNPYNLNEQILWMAKNFTVGTYNHPIYGPCTKFRFTLRPDLYWHDGTPVTTKDVYFTIVESAPLLQTRGYPNPWYWSAVRHVLSLYTLDPMTFEILIDIKSVWAFSLTGAGVRILPEHIWRPIITSGDPTTTAPDKNMIGCGPWRISNYTSGVGGVVELVANTPGRAVTTTGAPFTGSTAVTNLYGYHRWSPLHINIQADPNYRHEFTNCTRPLIITLKNEWLSGAITVDKNVSITFDSYNNGTTKVLASLTGIVIPAGGVHVETFTFCWPWGKHTVTVDATITAPTAFASSKSVTATYWVTIREDFSGALYYGNIAADIRVDIQDVARASAAFGTYPGHPKWIPIVDQNSDYKIDIQDIARVAARFGWHYGIQ